MLADLQSTTSHIAAHQQEQQQQHPPPTYQRHTVTKTTKINTELPTDNSPAKHNQDSVDGQPVYEPQIVKTVKRSQTETTTTSVSRTQYNINPLPLTSTNGITPGQHALPSSGENKVMTPLSNNLSELDSLLQDLSSAQFMAEVDRRNAANTGGEVDSYPRNQTHEGRDRTVDSLLYELESFVPPNRPADDGGSHYELVRPVQGTPSSHTPGPASSATRELDDLMASLSEFKQGGPKHVGDPPYATVNKPSRQAFAAENIVQHQMQTSHASAQKAGLSDASGGQDQQNNNLETMLGNLSTDMSRQGIMTVPKGHCAACAKPIIGQVITALGKIWHPEHFVCGHCKEPLGTRNFFERDDLPFCERDYHMLFSPRCAQCNGAILDKCITALDKTWHPEHFVCAECGRQFGDAGFHEKDGKAYCRDDYFNMFAPRCAGCNQPIMDNFISALNQQWHPECFVCYECHMPFGSTSFFDHEGYPYCETHYHAKRGSLCAGCHKPITGRCITAMYKKFHPEHFVCAFCLKQLNKGTFKEENDKPYCHPCFAKLFG